MDILCYNWSGNYKTILDIGSNDVILASFLQSGISVNKDYFRYLVQHPKYLPNLKENKIKQLKYEIRRMQKLVTLLYNAFDACIPNQEEAARKAYEFIMPWKL